MNSSLSDLWRWPLHSPRRLLATLVVIAALVVGASFLFSSGSGRPSVAPAPGPSSAPTSLPPTPAPSVSPSASRDLSAALDTARAFTTAWASHPADWRAWYAGTARYATAAYAQLLASVDPANIQATRITGPGKLTDSGQARTMVALPTDAGAVSLVLVQDASGTWHVDDLRPGAQAVE